MIFTAKGKKFPTLGSHAKEKLTTNVSCTRLLRKIDVISGNLFVLTASRKTLETTAKMALWILTFENNLD